MAKKTTRKPAARHYPVQTTMGLAEASTTYGNVRLIEGDRLLSMTNRRMYRQSRVYSMKVDIDPFALVGQGAAFSVYCLRDTWDLHGAYKWAMKNYYNAMKEELQTGGANTRWHDFRVHPYNNADLMVPLTFTEAPAIPISGGLTVGDFDYAQVSNSAGVTRKFTLSPFAIGDLDILAEWQKKDRVQNDPAATQTDLSYAGLVEDHDETNYDLLRVMGAEPPYDQEASLSPWRKVAELNADSNFQKLSTGFFDAPLGVVLLVQGGLFTSGGDPDDFPRIRVTFQKGDYKGVKAPSYATPFLTEAKEYEVV